MEFKKTFTPAVRADFSGLRFYEIPYPFFAQWLNLVLEIAKIIQPDFHVEIPKKRLDWFSSPDQEVFDLESGTAYTLRTSSMVLKNDHYRLEAVAQYGYHAIPGQFIVVKTGLSQGSVFARNSMKDNTIDFDITIQETLLPAVEEVFYLFQ